MTEVSFEYVAALVTQFPLGVAVTVPLFAGLMFLVSVRHASVSLLKTPRPCVPAMRAVFRKDNSSTETFAGPDCGTVQWTTVACAEFP